MALETADHSVNFSVVSLKERLLSFFGICYSVDLKGLNGVLSTKLSIVCAFEKIEKAFIAHFKSIPESKL